jgi:hypothetical protein
MREFSDQRQILRRVTGPNSRIIFVKHYIENPMRRVFNSPMTSHRISGPFSIRCQAGDIDATRFLTTMAALIRFENIGCFGRAFFLRSLLPLLRRAFSFKDAFDFGAQSRMIILERRSI